MARRRKASRKNGRDPARHAGASALGGGEGAPRPAHEPIVVTAQFDEGAAAFFQRLRSAYYPAALDRVPAHLTLFHALPGKAERDVVETIAGAAGRTGPFSVRVAEPIALGRGVAFRIESERLLALREAIAGPFRPRLTGQDRERFRPHVTIQNKVSPAHARATLSDIGRAFAPFDAVVDGIQLWRYVGGPWRPMGVFVLGTA